MKKTHGNKGYGKYLLGMVLAITLITVLSGIAKATPVGPLLLSNSTSAVPSWQASPLEMDNGKGKITTMVFNVTQQDMDWKAYVGNVTGRLSLDDSDDKTIFDWALTTAAGEVYATRKAGAVTWANIQCANVTNVEHEQTDLNIGGSEVDSIANTFDSGDHSEIIVGTKTFVQDDCNYTGFTYVNEAAQTTNFDEILLQEESVDGLIYAVIIANDATGYNGDAFDFQILLPDDGDAAGSSTYYFYTELT